MTLRPLPRRRPAARLALAALVLLLGGPGAGCSMRLRAPRVTVERLSVQGLRLTSVGVDVDLLLSNPNREPLRIEGFEYELEIDGRRLGTGFSPGPLEIAAFAQVPASFRLDVSTLGLAAGIRELLDSDRARVKVEGTFHLAPGSPVRRLRAASEAVVPLER